MSIYTNKSIQELKFMEEIFMRNTGFEKERRRRRLKIGDRGSTYICYTQIHEEESIMDSFTTNMVFFFA